MTHRKTIFAVHTTQRFRAFFIRSTFFAFHRGDSFSFITDLTQFFVYLYTRVVRYDKSRMLRSKDELARASD